MSNDNYNRLKGKRCIGLVRCSTVGQAATSIPDQINALEKFAQEHGLIIVDMISLPGVSGSIPGNRDDLEKLIDRKRERDDFEILLVFDITRLTRGGARHGAKIEYDFLAAGVEIVYVMEQLPEGAAGELVKSFQFYSANEQARAIAKNTARGAMSALEQGRLGHCRRPPYGTDRLYRGWDGKARFILRNLVDGTQIKLDPQTREVIERFGRNPKTGKPTRNIKLSDEDVELVPGAEEAVDTVRLMYRRRFSDGWGCWKISKELDSLKILSPSGKRWNKETVMDILTNSIYLGVGVAIPYAATTTKPTARPDDVPAETA